MSRPDAVPTGTLADLSVGETATVRALRVGEGAGRCGRSVARRLMEMGLLPGTDVKVVRIAPLGDPLMLQVRGYSLSIRRTEAASISVDDVLAPGGSTRTTS